MIDFICIGAQKSGTTLLYEQLKNIEEIYIPPQKELHYFNNDVNFSKGRDFYLKYFALAKPYQIKGEITPAYLFFKKVPHRIKNFIGDYNIKFIVLLRNPVDRAYSQYNMSFSVQKNETLNFEQALLYERYRLNEYMDWVNHTYVSRGFYSRQILNYFKYFDKKQFKFIIYEEFVDNQNKYINEILNFLDVQRKVKVEDKVVFKNIYKPMQENTRFILEKIYENEIRVLENILDIDLSVWKRGK